MFGQGGEDKSMVRFFEETWFVWWVFAIVVIVRWFYIVSADRAWEDSLRATASPKTSSVPRGLKSSVS